VCVCRACMSVCVSLCVCLSVFMLSPLTGVSVSMTVSGAVAFG